MRTRIGNVVRYVADQDRAVAFWTEVLGFEVRVDTEMWPGARWIEVGPVDGESGITLLAATDFADDAIRASAGFTLVTDDLAAAHADLAAKGIDVSDPVTEPFGTFISFTDPDGYDYVLSAPATDAPFAGVKVEGDQ